MPHTPIELLKKHYGYTAFRKGQEDIIEAITAGRDCLAVMPTGAGKSLCYQIPALLFPGITLVVSPLISLMRDQVSALTQNGIPAAYINSSLTPKQTDTALARAREGRYKIIYIAPERLDTAGFLSFAESAGISLAAMDEAHCVSQWGQDFRPSYLNIPGFIAGLPKRPVVAAFTATATDEVKNDIIKLLGLNSPLLKSTGFNRENLYFEVRRPRDKYAELTEYLRENAGKSGIIYASTRKAVDEITRRLRADGFSARAYHAGLSQDERNKAQEDFLYDRVPLITATVAFGMGIDKSNVSFVIHYNMPKNIEGYYQEAGRAGRDGSPADCILFYAAQDVIVNRYLIENSGAEADGALTEQMIRESKARDFARLKQMERYCKTSRCLRRFILDYFGDREDCVCGNCGSCSNTRETHDITVEAQKILSCISRMKGRYGVTAVIDVLRGAQSEKIAKNGLDSIKTYGIMADMPQNSVRAYIEHLTDTGYIASDGGEYPVINITEKAKSVLFGGETVSMPVFEDENQSADNRRKRERREKRPAARAKFDSELFNKLKALRLEIARGENVPAFVIFSDAALADMCARMPVTDAAFLEVSGVGYMKNEKYGKAFIGAIREYISAQGGNADAPEPESGDTRNAEDLPEFIRRNFEYASEPVSITGFTDAVNALVYQKRDKGISLRKVTDMLITEGYLEDKEEDGKKSRVATNKGEAAGISVIKVESTDGSYYYQNLYNKEAQGMMLSFILRELL